ncbi:D-aspartate oxidase [Kwoniella heveanensis BCC8398]|uniref:D-aspartate oxidase n=1 Tax=Kwoniella heveanensis BCC8398 TaxID=1296120 RepID=A0A1B9GXD4_9TREE|nr:D-aspartate oxidase [Kwoniella heveanensis BCC8398]
MLETTTVHTTQRPIIVLGAGIIGLTTAVRILESPLYHQHHHPVHIIADHLPNDPLDPKYASTIAGAHHLSFADDDDERQRRWDRRTFQVMYDEWRADGEATGLMVLKQTELFVGNSRHLKIYEEHPGFTVVDQSSLPSAIDYSVSFTSLTMTPITYLNRLIKRINQLSDGNVSIHRHHLHSLSDLSHPSVQAMIGSRAIPLAVVVCTGLGSLTLGGVEDKTVFPTRGQVVKIKAPWVRSGYTRQIGGLNGGEGGERTYVIPRADGEVILGGTREEGDWMPYPREETTRDILSRVVEICPELVPKHLLAPALERKQDNAIEDLTRTSGSNRKDAATMSSAHSPSPLDSLIVENLVGFRPSRQNGTRLERGPNLVLSSKEEVASESAVVVYNYGHGGAGWQSCWGTAEDAMALLDKSLS